MISMNNSDLTFNFKEGKRKKEREEQEGGGKENWLHLEFFQNANEVWYYFYSDLK